MLGGKLPDGITVVIGEGGAHKSTTAEIRAPDRIGCRISDSSCPVAARSIYTLPQLSPVALAIARITQSPTALPAGFGLKYCIRSPPTQNFRIKKEG